MLPSLTRRNKSILVHSTCLCQVTHLHLLFASFLLQTGILSPCFCSEPQCMFWENQPCFHVICSVRVPALHNSKHYQLEVQPAHTQQAQPSLTLCPFSAGVSGHPAGTWPMLWVLLHSEANKSEHLEHSANLIILVSKKCLIYWIRFCCTFFFIAVSIPVCMQNCGCGTCSPGTTWSHSPIPHQRDRNLSLLVLHIQGSSRPHPSSSLLHKRHGTTTGCDCPVPITFVTKNFCFSPLRSCQWQSVPCLCSLCPLRSLFRYSSRPLMYRLKKGQRLKMPSQLGLCPCTDFTRLWSKMSSSSMSGRGRASGPSESRDPKKWFRRNVEEDAPIS